MKMTRFQRRLVYSTAALVAVIFAVAMVLVYVGERNKTLADAVQSEQIDLDRNMELLAVMLREGQSMYYVKKVATSPWKDGSGDYIIIDDTFNHDTLDKDDILITSTIKRSGESLTVGEILSKNRLLQPLRRTFNHLAIFTIVVLLVFFFTIRYAIKRISQPEVDRQYRLDYELDIARRLQDGMLPKSADSLTSKSAESLLPAGVEIGTLISPSKEIGGDFFNYLMAGDHLHFIIADVSGKGIPAALYMAVATKLYASIAANDPAPREVATHLNNALSADNPESMFTTAMICRLDLKSGVLEMCNAGHLPPLVVGSDEAPKTLDGPNNIPLGLMEGYEYEQYSADLKPGSHLVLYTDGVTEAEDKRHDQFGMHRFMESVETDADTSASLLVGRIHEAIAQFTDGREQSDDITILDVKYI